MKKIIIRIVGLSIACIMLVAFISSCGSSIKPGETPEAYKDGVIGENKAGVVNGLVDAVSGLIPSRYDKAYSVAEADRPTAELWEDGTIIGEPGDYHGSTNIVPKAGLLTAGELKDRINLEEWIKTFDEENWKEYLNKRGLYSNNVISVKVKNGDSYIYNQKVELVSNDGIVIYTSKTDINGEAYLFYSDSEKASVSDVRVGNDVKKVDFQNKQDVIFETNYSKEEIKELDLMLMVDTTGSMSDELEYLKEELADMVNRIGESNQVLSIRVSVNFYRDEGDDYVVKYYDFRSSIDECVKQLSEQRAEGGGDYPEAVHTALENAITGHTWRENAVKICFFVLDAPPHTESEIQGINANILKSLKIASENGIRIVPVASSGVDKDTEYILRSFALMTGGTYIFLTNHSGIGNSHIEPSAESYTVEPLNECMIRVVCEYCGLKYEARYTYTEQQENSNQQ